MQLTTHSPQRALGWALAAMLANNALTANSEPAIY